MKILREEISRIKELMDLEEVEFSGDTESTEELGEQEDSATSTSSSGGGAPSVPVWASGRNLGKTYMNDPNYKWESGLTRGKANSLY
jgi:hypothetical protein